MDRRLGGQEDVRSRRVDTDGVQDRIRRPNLAHEPSGEEDLEHDCIDGHLDRLGACKSGEAAPIASRKQRMIIAQDLGDPAILTNAAHGVPIEQRP